MSEDPTWDKEERPNDTTADYEAPSIKEVETEDSPAVTAAGDLSPPSDLRLKRSLRPLDGVTARLR